MSRRAEDSMKVSDILRVKGSVLYTVNPDAPWPGRLR